MEKHFRLSDQVFLQQFQALNFPPAWFSHEAHLRLAYIHINQFGLNQAIENIREQIKAFATFHGEREKYNDTLTVAAVRIVHHFIQKNDNTTFSELLEIHLRLKTDFMGLINTHYSKKTYATTEAKAEYLEPDLLPFP